MKLKTRIFSLMGGLFLGSFVISTVLEIFFSRQAAINTNQILESTLENYETRRQEDVALYLKDKVQNTLANIEGILEKTNGAEFWNYYFSPADFNVRTNHWLTSSLFLTSNKMLDLIQTEINNKITSQIILDRPPPYIVYAYDLVDEVKLCVIDPQVPQVEIEGPYVAIPFEYEAQTPLDQTNEVSIEAKKKNPFSNYLIFKPEQIKSFDPNQFDKRIESFFSLDIKSQNVEDYPLNIAQVLDMRRALPLLKASLLKAQAYFKQNEGYYLYLTEKKNAWLQDQFHNLYDVNKGLNEKFDELEIVRVRFNQIAMVWQYTSYISTGATDYQVNEGAPYGLAMINLKTKKGPGIIAEDILENNPVEVLSPSIYKGPNNRIFLGNKINIDLPLAQEGLRRTILTVGIDIRELLRGLSLVTRRSAIVVVNQKIVAATDLNGEMELVQEKNFPLNILLNAPTGSFKGPKGDEYIFLTTKIFPNENVYLILYRLKSVEFGFIDAVSTGLKKLVQHLTIQNIIISILTLALASYLISRLAYFITNPILILAKNSKNVKEGHLDQVDLPPFEEHGEDEIEDLYHSFSEMVKGLKEKEKVKGILNKVVSQKIANKILEGNITLGGEEKVVTVLFADIRHFTQMTEQMKPTELIQVLNSYMTRLADVIDKNNGVIDKYVGDEVMALFGAPVADTESAAAAVSCALEMMKEVENWNANRIRLGLNPIDIGIGIHTGIVVAGNVGAENRLNYTVLGANVNLASRLCAAAEAKQILISKDTLNAPKVKEMISYNELSPISLKGFSKLTQVYEVLPIESSADSAIKET
jgi:class 3 adenylate cyclase